MPNIETRDRFAKFDIDATLGDIKTDLSKIYRKALTAFVREMASKIPVLTGQARSSVIGAAKELGLDPRITLSAAPVTNNPQLKAKMMARGNNPRRGRTLGHGALLISDNRARSVSISRHGTQDRRIILQSGKKRNGTPWKLDVEP